MNSKTTKRALLTSVLSLALCLCMLVGTTFAWFTDSVTVGGNKIQAGTLDIKLYQQFYADASVDPEETELTKESAPVFDYEKWEPGYVQIANFRINNAGSLAAKYQVNLVPVGEIGKLAEAIDVYVCVAPLGTEKLMGAVPPRFVLESMITNGNAENVGSLKDVMLNSIALSEGVLEGNGDNGYLFMALKMREDAGNEYQNQTVGMFDIRVLAAQATVESDSFDENYDKDATYADVWDGSADFEGLTNNTNTENKTVVIETAEQLAAFGADVNENGNTYAGYTVTLADNIDLMGKAWTPIGQTGATEFKGVFDGNGHTIYNLFIDNKDESATCSTGLFGWIESHGNEGVTVKNLTVDGAEVSGHHYVGVIVGYVYGTIENCHVKNASVSCTSVNDDANGDKAGLIAGYVGEDASIKNCTGADSAVSAGRDAGQIVGAAKPACVTGCSAENVTVTANGTSTGKNINEAVIGRVL